MDEVSQAVIAVSIFSPHDRPGPFRALAMPCEVEISVINNMHWFKPEVWTMANSAKLENVEKATNEKQSQRSVWLGLCD
jgi:hypothetical protein